MPDRPNILWICTDQQRWNTLSSLGYEHVRTPHLDQLAADGVTFTNAYSQSTICTPSRASFLTGRYPSTIHVNRNGNDYFPDGLDLITKKLADNGYDCGLAGKFHLSAAHLRMETRIDDGYRVYLWNHFPWPESFWPTENHAYQTWLQELGIEWDDAYGAEKVDGWEPSPRGKGDHRIGIEAKYHQTTWCANEACKFMCEDRQEPWLMSLNIFDPHPPFDPPPEYAARMDVDGMPMPLFQAEELESQLDFAGVYHQTPRPVSPYDYDAKRMVAAYIAQIELIDDQVGRMLQALEESGQRENTIIIYTSDHGEMLGDHGLLHKGSRFYEGAVHVPLILSWPGHFQSGLRSDALVELLDIMPTLLECIGLPIPEYVQGRTLLPILSGQADPHTHREFVRCEYLNALLAEKTPTYANMIFDGRYKLCIYHGQELGELYDLETDPDEFNNLWNAPECYQLRYELMRKLFDHIMMSTDPGQPFVGYY